MEAPPSNGESSDERSTGPRLPRAHGQVHGQVNAEFADPTTPARRDREAVVLIDRRRLMTQCMEVAFRLADPGTRFAAYATIDEWQASTGGESVGLVVLCTDGSSSPEAEAAELRASLERLREIDDALHVVVTSNCECPHQIVQALEAGVRGYVPSSTSLGVAVQAFQLVRAGGVYVPASILSAVVLAAKPVAQPAAAKLETEMFSPRQLRVARALRMGVPNKIIAYELNMCESTVKVHVRNIMKKLKARNRTEVAFLTNHLFSTLDDEETAAGPQGGSLNGHHALRGTVADQQCS